MCGFANTSGGMAIVGVNSKLKIVGVKEDTDILQQKISAAAQAISHQLCRRFMLRHLMVKK
jgi:predicted HTH transcriptional regulator